jgi:hypothetical protein
LITPIALATCSLVLLGTVVALVREVRLRRARDVDFVSAEAPAVCSDGRRRYAWAMLSPEAVIPQSENAVRFESSIAGQSQSAQANGRPQVDATASVRRPRKHSRSESVELPSDSPSPLSSVDQVRILQTGLRFALRRLTAATKSISPQAIAGCRRASLTKVG